MKEIIVLHKLKLSIISSGFNWILSRGKDGNWGWMLVRDAKKTETESVSDSQSKLMVE